MLEVLGWIFLSIIALAIPGVGPGLVTFAFSQTFSLSFIESFGLFGLIISLQLFLYLWIDRVTNEN